MGIILALLDQGKRARALHGSGAELQIQGTPVSPCKPTGWRRRGGRHSKTRKGGAASDPIRGWPRLELPLQPWMVLSKLRAQELEQEDH